MLPLLTRVFKEPEHLAELDLRDELTATTLRKGERDIGYPGASEELANILIKRSDTTIHYPLANWNVVHSGRQ